MLARRAAAHRYNGVSMRWLVAPWPWYVAGPLIGLVVPLLLWLGNKPFGVSSNLRHVCAAVAPCGLQHFQYDWRREGGWNLLFVLGIAIGGFLGGVVLANPEPIALSAEARATLASLGITDVQGLAPRELFRWASAATLHGFILFVVGGFAVGFGTAYAGGCTSGHAITGLADRQLPSLVAVLGFFAGGLLATWVFLPRLL
jgi:uncharacterized membrane protein YedE/YeeE